VKGRFQPQQVSIQGANNPALEAILASFVPSFIAPFEPTRASVRKSGLVHAYAANTHQGLIRNYNEDRVSIITNINKIQTNPPSKTNVGVIESGDDKSLVPCAFFAVYDGHGGANCADYLRDSLHDFIVKEGSFPDNIHDALKNGFARAENKFLDLAQQKNELDRSGSCAITTLIIGMHLYVWL
jgi:protein phosphatase 2C family protein 2/3